MFAGSAFQKLLDPYFHNHFRHQRRRLHRGIGDNRDNFPHYSSRNQGKNHILPRYLSGKCFWFLKWKCN